MIDLLAFFAALCYIPAVVLVALARISVGGDIMRPVDICKASELRFLYFPYAVEREAVPPAAREMAKTYEDICAINGWPYVIYMPMDSPAVYEAGAVPLLFHVVAHMPSGREKLNRNIKLQAYQIFQAECMTVAREPRPRFIPHRPRAIEILDVDAAQARTMAFRLFDLISEAYEADRLRREAESLAGSAPIGL